MKRSPFLLTVLSAIAIVFAGCNKVPPPETSESTTTVSTTSLPDPDFDVPDPTGSDPVSVGMAIAPQSATAGDALNLVIRLKTATDWHIYAVNQPTGVSIPTTLELRLPDGITANGDWQIPTAESVGDGAFGYHGQIVFRHQLTVADTAAPGNLEIGCQVGYQACDPNFCRPPRRVDLTAQVQISE